MNKQEIIYAGNQLLNITDLLELQEHFETWKVRVLEYAKDYNELLGHCRMQLHIGDIAHEPKEVVIKKHRDTVKGVLEILQNHCVDNEYGDALEQMICNFNLFLKYLLRTRPENKSSIDYDLLEKIKISNEYDLQHIMYAMIKTLYPSARREVNQDTGYGTVRYDISIADIGTVIEIKCTRSDHSEKKVLQELGEDAYFYSCSKLIMYIYDKNNVIKDIGNFKSALSRTHEQAGKEVIVFVEQQNSLV